MKLKDFTAMLLKLESTPGAGSMEVFYRHGASGDCGPLSHAHITCETNDECGPFDLSDGEFYISVYAGN